MKVRIHHPITIVLSVALASAAGSMAAPENEKGAKQFISIRKSEIKWQDAPSIGRGAKTAVIEGDPKSGGSFTMRIQAPANTKIGVHTHPVDEKVTVLDGTLYFSTGDKFDPKKATAYNAGDAFIVPQGVAMYAFTKNKPATLQIHGMGPWGITYMDPADDPMKRGKK